MNLFKRLFKVGQAEGHAIVDKMEDPEKMMEQGIRDLKKSLSESMEALAQVKADTIHAERKAKQFTAEAKSYEAKALKVLQKGQDDGDESKAEKLATELLEKHAQVESQAKVHREAHQKSKKALDALQNKISTLKQQVQQHENELTMVKSRAKVAKTSAKINKQLSSIDTSSTVSMLERMKAKVDEEEAMADSYAAIAAEETAAENAADDFLNEADEKVEDKLAALKGKLK